MSAPITHAALDQAIADMTNAFLRWPLPESVNADGCATRQGKGRSGTNLMSVGETLTMMQEVVRPVVKQLIADSEAKAVAANEHELSEARNAERLARTQLEAARAQRDALLEITWLDMPDEPVETVEQWRVEFENGWERKSVCDQLRAEVERLTAEVANQKVQNNHNWQFQEISEEALKRAERAEADADSTRERAITLANSLDGAQAELAELKESVLVQQIFSDDRIRANEAEAELAAERARLDWLEGNAGDIPKWNRRSFIWFANQNLRAAIDAAMKEDAK